MAGDSATTKVQISKNPEPEQSDNSVIEAVAISGMLAESTQPAMLSNLAYSNTVANTNLSGQNAVANQQSLNQVGASILGKTVNMLNSLGPLEAKSSSVILTGNTIAEQVGALKASMQAFKRKS